MKLRIEKWVEETKPFRESGSANEFFEESVRCYKIGAYKSAFIMSYLSFKITIRDRILECDYGRELTTQNPRFWEDVLIPTLNNPDKWEKYLNDIIETSCSGNRTDMSIIHFRNGEEVRTEYNYWKNIRNDCAHAKRQKTIDSSTVESFWNYIIDNMSKFYVLGGEDYSLRELKNLYKFYRHPEIVEPEKVKIIMNDVNVICQNKPNGFLQNLFQNLGDIARGGLVDSTNSLFWKDVLESSSEEVRDCIIGIVSNDAQYFINFYNYFPQLLEMSFSLNSQFIVNELSNWLSQPHYSFYGSEKTFWVILIELLDRYRTHVDVDNIINKRTIELIDSLEQNERNLRILNNNNVFKRYIFHVSSWFFNTDASSQYNNLSRFQSKESEYIELCFNYLEWDNESIEVINYSLVNLESSMASRSNIYSRMNGFNFKSRCERIICNNKEKIMNVPNVDLDSYSHVLEILRTCISDQN